MEYYEGPEWIAEDRRRTEETMGYEDHNQFRADMKKAGYIVQEHRGKAYTGPAVCCSKEHMQYAIRATAVRIEWRCTDLGAIVYPQG